MKRKFVLLPLTLTAFTPVISMAACNNSGPEVKIDSDSDTTDIKISIPKIILNQELIITYEMINQEKVLDINNSWIKFDSSQFPLSNPEFKCENNKIIIPAEKVTTYDITICLKSMNPNIPKSVELTYGQGLKDDIEITHDQTLTFSCVVYPSTAPQDFVLRSENGLVADFDGNILKPNPNNNSGGTTEIIARCKDNPGVVSNVIRVTVKPKPSTLSIDYSNVNFDTTITVGSTSSSYRFQGFDADFVFETIHFFGNHTVTPCAEWVDGSGLEPLDVKIINPILNNNHTTFGIDISCPFTQWVVEHKYYYTLSFLIDGGEEVGGKTIIVDKNLYFVNHSAQTPTIIEPTGATLVPDDYGASVTIKGCSSNFRIGSDFQNTLELGAFNFASGHHFASYPSITNLKNTATGATFDIKANCDGIDLSQDIVFCFDYTLNGAKIKTSQNYTIASNRYIECSDVGSEIELDDFNTPSVTVDGFVANFEFDNLPSSSLPLVTASCESRDHAITNPSVSIVKITKGTGNTTFSLQIDFAYSISEPWVEKYFDIHFKIDGSPLVSDQILFFISTPPTLKYYGDGGQQQLVHGKYYDAGEEKEGYFTTIGVFSGGDISSTQITAEFEWNTSNTLPTPTKIIADGFQGDADKSHNNYITLVWPSAFTPDSSTFKLKVSVDGELALTLDDLSLMPLSPDDNFWNIESLFVGSSSGTATVSKNTQDEIIISLSSYETTKELWGVEFNYGGWSVPMLANATVNAQHNQITIKPIHDYCNLIPGLKTKMIVTYVAPSDIIQINQTEMYDETLPFYTSNEVDWKGGKTYYLRADFRNSPFVFTDILDFGGAFIGEFSETGTQKIADCKIYNNFFWTEQVASVDGIDGMYGFCSWAETIQSMKNNIMDFTVRVDTDIGTHKFNIFIGA